MEEFVQSTYEKHQIDFQYQKQRHYSHRYFSLEQLASITKTRLIPIRLDLEYEGIRLKDSFTWNVYEHLLTPEDFALILANDFDNPLAPLFVPMIAEQIRQQVMMYCGAVEDDFIEPVTYDKVPSVGVATGSGLGLDTGSAPVQETAQERFIKDNGQSNGQLNEQPNDQSNDQNDQSAQTETSNIDQEMNGLDALTEAVAIASPEQNGKPEIKVQDKEDLSYGDIRIVIKIDLHVGSLYLKDQFEWPLFEETISPEEFTRIMVADMGIAGEFVPMIAHAIREQLVQARLDFHEGLTAPDYSTPIREDEEAEWEPDLKLLDDEQILQMLKEEDRNNRRLRRQRQVLPTPVAPRRAPPTDFETPKPKIFSAPGSPTLSSAYQTTLSKQLQLLESSMHTPLPQTPVARSMQSFEQTTNGNFDLLDARNLWRCSWCLISGMATPRTRAGPLGPSTACDACGIWYARYGILPPERYHQHRDTA